MSVVCVAPVARPRVPVSPRIVFMGGRQFSRGRGADLATMGSRVELLFRKYPKLLPFLRLVDSRSVDADSALLHGKGKNTPFEIAAASLLSEVITTESADSALGHWEPLIGGNLEPEGIVAFLADPTATMALVEKAVDTHAQGPCGDAALLDPLSDARALRREPPPCRT